MAGFLHSLVRSRLFRSLRLGFQKKRLRQRFRRTLFETLDRRDLMAGVTDPLLFMGSLAEGEGASTSSLHAPTLVKDINTLASSGINV